LASGLAVLAAAGIVLFAWSGIYNVAASRGHFAVVRWFLEFGMRNSVELHAAPIRTPGLDDPALVERGAGHFHTGCAPCHGAPGVEPNPIAQKMLPHPPELSAAVPGWYPNELFWIVKHGLKYTGMPGWPASSRDDEVWAVVAFLVRLPKMDAGEYRRLTQADSEAPESERLRNAGALLDTAAVVCARCHRSKGEGGSAGGVPRIAGQRADYIAMTLRDYARGTRPSGIMGPVALGLTGAEHRQLAEHYASQSITGEPSPQGRPAPAEALQLGATIATEGMLSRSIPPCESCHGPKGTAEGKDPRFPALAEQSAAYLEQQLRLWRDGKRGGTLGQIMSGAVGKITDEQIHAVSLYYAALPSGR
jgi:cytochrome c553